MVAAQPLHTYLTYSDDPATTIDINLVIKEKVPGVSVYFDTKSRDGERDKYANHAMAAYYQTTLEILDRRACYMACLKDLKPGETYYFVAGDEENGFTKERSFRTLRGGDAPLRFINGGDMGTSPRTEKLLKLAGEVDPEFGVIGGDIPYSNGLLAEYGDWEKWFANWDKYMVGKDGRMIPIVAAIGNHEVNRYESENFELRSPDYYSLLGRQGDMPYFSRKFGDNVVFFLLDSGHLCPHEGTQTTWLEQEFEKYRDVKWKFAAYHVPLYPTYRPYDGEGSKKGRTYWGPLFDKYGLTVGFEHHDHVFKRTKPIKGEQVVDKGTIYVGDGAFGVDPRKFQDEQRPYDEKRGSIAHFWVVDVTSKKVSLKAIDEDGKTIDSFDLP